MDSLLNEKFTLVRKIWEDLGVSENYQLLFTYNINSFTEDEKQEMINEEINSLKVFGDVLLKLKKEKKLRKNNIISLKKYINSLINELNDKNDTHNLINNIIDLIQSLRLNVVNIMQYFLKVREILTYYTLVGKIDIEKLNKNYEYDPAYILKLKKDLEFLNEYEGLEKYFDIDNIDEFFTNFALKDDEMSNYVNIQIPDILINNIGECNYILLQEKIYQNLNNININNNYERLKSYLSSLGIFFNIDILDENLFQKQKIEKLNSYITEMKTKISNEEKEREQIEYKKFKQNKQKELEYELKIQKLEFEQKDLIQDKNYLNKELDEVTKLMEKKKDEHLNKEENLNSIISKLKSDIDNCNILISKKNSEIEDLNYIISKQKSENQNCNSLISNQNLEISNYKTLITNQNRELEKCNTLISNQKKQLNECNTLISDLKIKMDECSALTSKQKEKIDSCNILISEQKQQIKRLEKLNVEQNEACENYKKIIEDLKIIKNKENKYLSMSEDKLDQENKNVKEDDEELNYII